MGVLLPLNTLNHESLVLKLVMVVIQFHHLASEYEFVFLWNITFDCVISTVWVRSIYFFLLELYVCLNWPVG